MPHHSSSHWLSTVYFGQFVTRQWLLEQGVSKHSLDNAVKSKKLKLLSRGVLAREGVPIDWQGTIASLNRMGTLVYIGGISALIQQGLAHYVDFSNQVSLYSPEASPSWLSKLDLNTRLNWHRTARLWNMPDLLQISSLKKNEINNGYWIMASPEQAIFEVLMAVPEVFSFEYADHLMQGLVNLSPRRLDALLKCCKHIKAKRLFFFFADRQNHAWRKKLQVDNYDLGSGHRRIASNGKLDNKYQITIPKAFYVPK
ncbi:type IV toxin-antitoxin system AbiEi family antitoxin domain-containing protein [Advenella sp. RU8]|uniref:type IV toxin-antitoxin system AbiEi family antitoxin domain-containing protein n=1 Tax=Advenella sp. RU8 TaxID=3399575 RepID=UPI003AAC9A61